MRFQKEHTQKGVLIPVSGLKLSNLYREELELHTLEGAAVVLNGRMTAPELLATAQSLHALAAELLTHLALACGQCCGCGKCPDPADEDSPLSGLPPELLDAFTQAGVCLDLLEKYLILEDDVYGG